MKRGGSGVDAAEAGSPVKRARAAWCQAARTSMAMRWPRARGALPIRSGDMPWRGSSRRRTTFLSTLTLARKTWETPVRRTDRARCLLRLVEKAHGERCYALPVRRRGAVRGSHAADLHRRAVGVRRSEAVARLGEAVASWCVRPHDSRQWGLAPCGESGAGRGRKLAVGGCKAGSGGRATGRRRTGGRTARRWPGAAGDAAQRPAAGRLHPGPVLPRRRVALGHPRRDQCNVGRGGRRRGRSPAGGVRGDVGADRPARERPASARRTSSSPAWARRAGKWRRRWRPGSAS